MGLERRLEKFVFKEKMNRLAYILTMSIGFWKEYESLS